MENLSQLAFINQLFCQSHRRDPAVVVPDGIRNACVFYRLAHFLPLLNIHRERFFTENHLAGLGRCDGDLVMQIVWRANINGVNVIAFDEFAPIRLDGLISPLIGKSLSSLSISCANRLEHRLILKIKKVIDFSVGVRVGSPHEPVPDHSNIQWFLGHCFLHSQLKMDSSFNF